MQWSFDHPFHSNVYVEQQVTLKLYFDEPLAVVISTRRYFYSVHYDQFIHRISCSWTTCNIHIIYITSATLKKNVLTGLNV